MVRSLDSAIVSCALTGSIHTPTLSEHLPVTPDELILQGIDAADAGASIIHIHVRDPETGEPVSDHDLFREVAEGIQSETDAVVQPTTGGGLNQTVEERMSIVPELQPEMASLNMGSFNFGIYPIAEMTDKFEYDWEREYLESTRDNVFPNTFGDIEQAIETFAKNGTKPELECYDVGHLYNAKHFYEKGKLEPPLHLQFVMGIHGGIGAREEHLVHMAETADQLFGDDASWSVVGAGQKQFPLTTQAACMGGNVRVGLEDNLYIRSGELAKSNAEQVEKIVDLLSEVAGREPATPAETRDFLTLKGQDETAF
jgi:uncharacterized protein (DUF849 family)